MWPDPVGRDERRVLILTPYYPPHVGGVERYVESLVGELCQQTNWSIVVVTAGDRYSQDLNHTTDGRVGVYRLPWRTRLSNTPIGLAWHGLLRTIVAREQPSLVNAHAPVPGLADLAARLTRTCPFVLTYHTGPMGKDALVDDVLVRGYQRLVLPRTLRRADAIITASEYVRTTLPVRFRAQATTIHPGVDADRFSPGAPEPAGPDPRALFVGSLDRAARYKNLPRLLRALRALRDQGCRVRLTVVGDGDARADHEQFSAELGLAGQVTFVGALTGAELVRAYRAAWFLVLPTLFDSFGTVLAETMACGRPVVASATGGIPELVTPGVDGLLVAPDDTAGLCAAIRTLAEDADLRRRLGGAARTMVADRLSCRRQAQQTIAVFDRAAQRYRS